MAITKLLDTIHKGKAGHPKYLRRTSDQDQKQGCPQGSCSGPSLWNVVANEILLENWPINTSIQTFADDFVLVSHAPTRVLLSHKLTNLKFSTWASKNKLQILADKTNYLLISKLVRRPTIRWKGERIKRAHAIKYLGVYIDEKMNWNTRIKAQSTRATQLYQNLPKIAGKSWGVPMNHRRTLYKTVIERSVPPGNLRCLQDNLHGSSAGHTGYPSSSSIITKRSSWHSTLQT
ncbi:hypothetical protein AVEN_165506-1 [Araneus ventricosus]|uniref:Reverse transcriptase domain-containing protein n=1 Tax=Araneus ventricosus TaxID=182803 RepID=A0A4Y2K2R0_ARAVE|nr:hypothetical protein AVEN_165506-1 [Araneus ventricosus]